MLRSPNAPRRLDLHHDEQAARRVVRRCDGGDCRSRLSAPERHGSNFCRSYNLTRLVLAEEHLTIQDAIAREKALKAWKREWKIRLIEEANPEWLDLGADLVGLP